jgi:hypothetical protein
MAVHYAFQFPIEPPDWKDVEEQIDAEGIIKIILDHRGVKL